MHQPIVMNLRMANVPAHYGRMYSLPQGVTRLQCGLLPCDFDTCLGLFLLLLFYAH